MQLHFSTETHNKLISAAKNLVFTIADPADFCPDPNSRKNRMRILLYVYINFVPEPSVGDPYPDPVGSGPFCRIRKF
jgi:hypothetical protein